MIVHLYSCKLLPIQSGKYEPFRVFNLLNSLRKSIFRAHVRLLGIRSKKLNLNLWYIGCSLGMVSPVVVSAGFYVLCPVIASIKIWTESGKDRRIFSIHVIHTILYGSTSSFVLKIRWWIIFQSRWWWINTIICFWTYFVLICNVLITIFYVLIFLLHLPNLLAGLVGRTSI